MWLDQKPLVSPNIKKVEESDEKGRSYIPQFVDRNRKQT